MSKFLIAAGILAGAIGVAGCESMSSEEKGAVGGAVVGGVIGNQAGQAYDERKEREGK